MGLELNIQAVIGDLARPNLFEIEIPFLGENFKFHAKASSLPPSNLENVEIGYMNRKIGVAGDRTYEDWTVSCYNDENHEMRDRFLAWSNSITRNGKEIAGDKPEDYKKIGFVKHFARDGETVTKQVKLVGIYPLSVGDIALDWDSNNEVEVFEVNFHIDWTEDLV